MRKIKIVAISVAVYVIVTMVTFLTVLYVNDFRYNNEDGIYKIIERASDLSEEEREQRHLSDDYMLRITHIDFKEIGYFM